MFSIGLTGFWLLLSVAGGGGGGDGAVAVVVGVVLERFRGLYSIPHVFALICSAEDLS